MQILNYKIQRELPPFYSLGEKSLFFIYREDLNFLKLLAS